MTLTTKKSRPITIDGMEYRYQVSTTRMTEDWSFSLNLTVQNFELKGSVLQVMGLITRDFWLDFSDGPKWDKSDYPVITPKDISEIIRQAILAGWEPNKTGKSFKLNTSNDMFFNSNT